MCLSAHRRFPLGSEDDAVRAQGLEIMRKAIQLAQDVGIRVIQLAGYDVYYQEANNETRRRFRDGLKESVEMASRAQVTLAMEIMDYPLMNSISKALGYAHYLNNPWFQLYPDIGNLSAWDNDVQMELQAGMGISWRCMSKIRNPASLKTCRSAKGWWILNVALKRSNRPATAGPT
jgi:L-ribulose-5-phosphate 3-epimerase